MNQHTDHKFSSVRGPRPAFTLVELLVTISIIALLMGILLPALGTARNIAKKCKARSAVRQLMIGHALYQSEFDGKLMYGYPPAFVGGQPIEVTLPSGHTISAAHTFALPIQRYPIRMAPYQGNVWEILYDHRTPPERPVASDTQAEVEGKAYYLSVEPSFGINSTYVGGNYAVSKQGFVGTTPNMLPNGSAHVVFRDVEVKRTSELIVFAESRLRDGTTTTGDAGHHLATAPRENGVQWRANGDDFEVVNAASPIGLPQGRYTTPTVTGFFDGHAETLSATELDDMRLWANKATTADYDF